MSKNTTPPPAQTEPIRREEVIQLNDFRSRVGMKNHAWRMAKEQARELGIVLDLRHGRRCFVDCDRWIEFLERLATQRDVASS